MGGRRKMVDSGVEWIGDIPEGWLLHRIGDVSIANNGDWGEEPDENNVGVLCYRKADYRGNLILSGETRRVSKRAPFVQQLDTIVEKSGGGENRPVGEPALVMNNEPAICSNFMMRLRTKNILGAKFFFYANLAMYQSGEIYNLFKQTTGIQNVETGKYLATAIPGPTIPEQMEISSYLDHHTSRIDRERDLISAKIEALREKRKALIFECVTGKRRIVEARYLAGVDDWSDIECAGGLAAVPAPSQGDTFAKEGRLVDSGVEWIGDIPEGWKTLRVKETFSLRSTKSSGHPVYVGMDAIEGGTGRRISQEDSRISDGGVDGFFKAGDILFGKLRPYLQKVWLADTEGSCSTEFLILTPSITSNERYLSFVLCSEAFCLSINDKCGGVKMPRADWSDVGNEMLPFPSLDEQENITSYLDHYTYLIDKEIELLRAKSDLLIEKRKSLIFEAVTGKMNING